ncbi:MAG: M64 family metallopeptidase [Nanoarchaeota archaeon]|nr:M64 family metallopeptidase [Nanoarchaeota archaeon]
MAINLTIRQLYILILSIMALTLGIILIINVSLISTNLLKIQKNSMTINVFPENSQQGTIFLINAYYKEEKESQELPLTVVSKDNEYELLLFDDGKHYDKLSNDKVYGGFFDSSDKPIGDYEIKSNEESLARFLISKIGCEIIEGRLKEDSINFLIIPSGYRDYNEFKEDSKKLINSRDSLISLEPFNSYRERLSFSLLNTSRDFDCEVGCKNVPTLICCNNKKIFDEASLCGYDNIFVLVNNPGYCGSASTYTKICSKNKDSNLFLLHELGHSFANLADEYVYSDYYNYSIGEIENENCDTEGCSKWRDLSSGCFKGCTYSNLYRPIEKNSVMYDLYPEYDVVSQRQINNTILEYANFYDRSETPLLIKKSYYLDVKYDKGELNINRISIKPIRSKQRLGKSDFKYRIYNKERKKLLEGKIDVPTKIYPLPGSEEKIIIEDSIEFSLLLPYIKEADSLVIYSKDKQVQNLSLSSFNDECGDKICSKSENHLLCDKDCKIENDKFCENTKCDPDCPSQKYCTITRKIWFAIGIFFIIFAVIALFFIIRRNFRRGFL